MPYSTPHYQKLQETLNNVKLPDDDVPRVQDAIQRYQDWIEELDGIMADEGEPGALLTRMVQSLNRYRLYIDVNLVFDSPDDFLYRQKGQLKIDNSVLEEFLPRLVHPSIVPELSPDQVTVGPIKAYSGAYFESSLTTSALGGGLEFRTKDQDFAIAKALHLKASYSAAFEPGATLYKATYLAYVVAECKTNLDKTMFQEAVATSHDVKLAVLGARYYLLCEWLDMTPISTAITDIDEVIILRKARRIGAQRRAQFNTYEGRKAQRDWYIHYLTQNPLRLDMFQRFIKHIRSLLTNEGPDETSVLAQGFF